MNPAMSFALEEPALQEPRARIERKMGRQWSVMIGHGCLTHDEIRQWVKANNDKAGTKCFRAVGLPARPKPVKVEPEPAGLSLLERVIAERTLGLDKSNAVTGNTFAPENEVEYRIVAQMVAKGWMKENGTFYLTSQGITLLSEQRTLTFGLLG